MHMSLKKGSLTAAEAKSLALIVQQESQASPEYKPTAQTDHTKRTTTLLGYTINVGYLSLLVLVVQNASLVLLTRWSRSHRTTTLYKSSTLILVAEVMKMVSCLIYLFIETEKKQQYGQKLYHSVFCLETVKLGVPAALFMLQNYLLFVSLSNLDAMTFQLLSQIKLLLAAVFSVLLLERYLSCVQWSSVMLLTIGIMMSSQGKGSEKTSSQAAQNSVLGVVSCVVSGISSAFASVYFEKILKGTPPSIAVRNIQLGIFSLALSVVSMLAVDGIPGRDFAFFDGYGSSTWLLASIHAGGGILVAVVVKFADNILKGFATGVAIIVSGVYAAIAWGFTPTPGFIAGAIVVTFGTCIYNVPDPNNAVIDVCHFCPIAIILQYQSAKNINF